MRQDKLRTNVLIEEWPYGPLEYFTTFGPQIDQLFVLVQVMAFRGGVLAQLTWGMYDWFQFHAGHPSFPAVFFVCNPGLLNVPPPTVWRLPAEWAAEVQRMGCAKPFWVESHDVSFQRLPCACPVE